MFILSFPGCLHKVPKSYPLACLFSLRLKMYNFCLTWKRSCFTWKVCFNLKKFLFLHEKFVSAWKSSLFTRKVCFNLKKFLLVSSDYGVADGIGLRVLGLDGDDLRELGGALDHRGLVKKLVEHRASQIRTGGDTNLDKATKP